MNKIIKVKNIYTGEIFDAGIEWYVCNRRFVELYTDVSPETKLNHNELPSVAELMVDIVLPDPKPIKKGRSPKKNKE